MSNPTKSYLPNLLGENGEHAVPVRVTLVQLDNKAGRLVSSHLVYCTDESLAKYCDLLECEVIKGVS